MLLILKTETKGHKKKNHKPKAETNGKLQAEQLQLSQRNLT